MTQGNEPTKEKWTEGPWELLQYTTSMTVYPPSLVVFSNLGGDIAHLCQADSIEEYRANANLIAASTRLAKAAQAVLDWWEDHKDDTHEGLPGHLVPDYEVEPEFVTMAREALAKAKGSD